jgi:hypothetical protein
LSSGGPETGLVAELVAAGLPAAVVNPRQVRDFARATSQLAKTDKLDARTLARFGERMRPRLRKLPDQQELAFKALMYMSTPVAVRFNPALKSFYLRLRAAKVSRVQAGRAAQLGAG